MDSGIIQCMANLRYRNVEVVFSFTRSPPSSPSMKYLFFYFRHPVHVGIRVRTQTLIIFMERLRLC